MNDSLNLEVTQEGKVVSVITTTQVEKVPLSSKELKRQIDEHQAIIDQLQPQYETVLAFEQDNNVVEPGDVVSEVEPVVDEAEE